MVEVNIELENEEIKKFTFPTSWDEVTVEQFTRLFENKTPTENQLKATVRIMSSLSGIDEKILMMMDVEDFKKLSLNLSFIGEEVGNNNVDYIELDGEKYYLYKDFNKMTTGEIITIETIMDSTQGNIYKVMPQLLCLFLRKKKDNGKFEKFSTDMLDRADKFKNAKITDIHHIFNFFSTGEALFNHSTLDSISQ